MTLQNNSKIQRVVMQRIHMIHALQLCLNATVFSIGLFVLSVYAIGREVWVARVLQNEPSFANVTAFAHFYLAAFLDTRFIVQVFAVLALGALVWLVYNIAQMTRTASMSFA